jgi:hypothetical protein
LNPRNELILTPRQLSEGHSRPHALIPNACSVAQSLSKKKQSTLFMRPRDLMTDPFYAQVMFIIESKIHEYDQQPPGSASVKLTDSDVKSAIRKTMSILGGKKPVAIPSNERERSKGQLAIELVGVFEFLQANSKVSRGEYLKTLLAVEDSLKTRHEYYGRSRGYMDFLDEFIKDAKSRTADQ